MGVAAPQAGSFSLPIFCRRSPSPIQFVYRLWCFSPLFTRNSTTISDIITTPGAERTLRGQLAAWCACLAPDKGLNDHPSRIFTSRRSQFRPVLPQHYKMLESWKYLPTQRILCRRKWVTARKWPVTSGVSLTTRQNARTPLQSVVPSWRRKTVKAAPRWCCLLRVGVRTSNVVRSVSNSAQHLQILPVPTTAVL